MQKVVALNFVDESLLFQSIILGLAKNYSNLMELFEWLCCINTLKLIGSSKVKLDTAKNGVFIKFTKIKI